MRIRLVALAALPLLVLTACDPAGEVAGNLPPQPGPSGLPGAPIDLPADGLLGLIATATAANGAMLDLTMIVHQAVAATDAADAVAATTAWCAGEVDAQLLADQGYTFTTIDVTATSVSGEWPADATIELQPNPFPGVTVTATGSLRQTPTGSEGDFSPHCATAAQLDGAGSGTILLGIVGDADGDGDGTPPLGGWAHNLYGVNAHLSGGGASEVTFSDCIVKISELGSSLGAGTASGWATHLDDPTFCNIGGSFGNG